MSNQNTQMRYIVDGFFEICSETRGRIRPPMLVKIFLLPKISAVRYEYFETKAGFFVSLHKSQLHQTLQSLCELFVGASSVTNSEDGVSDRELSSPVKVPMALFGENAE